MSQEPARIPAPEIWSDLNQVGFAQWLHHPVTRAFLDYLGDYADALGADATEAWEAGTMDTTPEAQRVWRRNAGRAVQLRELQRITLSDIRHFYDVATTSEETQ